MSRKYFIYKILLAIAALSLAIPAAYFSVFGLYKLYIGAGIAGIILFSAIEFGKIVSISYLYRFWKKISWGRKIYLLSATIVAMLLTSVGIYGFLSSAFQSTSTNIEYINNHIKVIENKKSLFHNKITSLKEQLQIKTDRVVKLSSLRAQQESRLDTLYRRGMYVSARTTESNIKETNMIIDKLNEEIEKINYQISQFSDSITMCDVKIMELNNNQYQHDLGPLKYVSELMNVPMNKIINWLTLAIIFIFDPFAIALLLAFNHITVLSHKNDDNSNNNDDSKEKKKGNKNKKFKNILQAINIFNKNKVRDNTIINDVDGDRLKSLQDKKIEIENESNKLKNDLISLNHELDNIKEELKMSTTDEQEEAHNNIQDNINYDENTGEKRIKRIIFKNK